MEWVLVISMFLGFDVEPVEFATEAECMAAAALIAQADPTLEWIDDPDTFGGGIQPVIRNTVECEGPEDRLEQEPPVLPPAQPAVSQAIGAGLKPAPTRRMIPKGRRIPHP